jgi:hypothetical protein
LCPVRNRVVGLVRFELTTSRLSSARSNQLSYKPPPLILRPTMGNAGEPARASPPSKWGDRKEKRRRRNPGSFASDRRKPIEALFQESVEDGPDKSGGV